ncbi:MAG TPA: hypothetical protein PLH79_13050 [bacterium]|nr:hypothetical protein [bacterium]
MFIARHSIRVFSAFFVLTFSVIPACPASVLSEQEIKQDLIEILSNLEYLIDANMQGGELPEQGSTVQSLTESQMTLRQVLQSADAIMVTGVDSLTPQDLYLLKMLSMNLQIARELTDLKNQLASGAKQESSFVQVGQKKIASGPIRMNPLSSGDALPASDTEFPKANYSPSVLGDFNDSRIETTIAAITTVFSSFLNDATGLLSNELLKDTNLGIFGNLNTINPLNLINDFIQDLTFKIHMTENRHDIAPLYIDFYLASLYNGISDICNNITASFGISFGVSVVVKFDVGINANFICIGSKTLANMHQFVYAKRSFMDSDIDSAEIEGSYERLEYIHRQLKDVNQQILDSNTELEENIKEHIETAETNLTNEIHENQDEINANEVKIDQLQWTLDNVSAKREIHLQVLELKNKAEYLIAADEAGSPVDLEVPFLSVRVASDANQFTVYNLDLAKDVEVQSLGGGLHLLKLRLPKGVSNATILILHVKDSHDGGVSHYGFAMTPVTGMKF